MIWILVIFLGVLLTIAFALRLGWAWRLAVDLPNARSLHTRPTPRVGGMLAMPWVLLGVGAFSGAWAVSGLAGLLWLISFLDDRLGLPVVVRFGTHLLLALLLGLMSGNTSIMVLVLITLGTAWMINLYNFMDGSDGLAGGMAVFGFGAYAAAAYMLGDQTLVLMSLSIVLGVMAFLVFNFPPASIFLGDAGSTVLGFLAAALGLSGWQSGVWPLWFPMLVFSPFIVDASITLVKRGLRGERVWQAHRDHYYQRLVRMGWGHRRTALTEYAFMLVASILGLLLLGRDVMLQGGGLLAWGGVLAGVMVWVDFAWARYLKERGNEV